MTNAQFQKIIYDYYKKNKRALPWRKTHNPYYILVSEMMLQQTQSSRVIPKYAAFLKKFPTVKVLAKSDIKNVLRLWQGLGYNRRALMLNRIAIKIVKEYESTFPCTYEELRTLPGVGPYTASAIMTFAYNKPCTMIETNIRAVFIHFFFQTSQKVPDKKLIPLIEKYGDHRHPRIWYNALMDYGAMLKDTNVNPSRRSTHHVTQSTFKGSVRQVRGAIIRVYVENYSITKATLLRTLPYDKEVIKAQYQKLKTEGFFK